MDMRTKTIVLWAGGAVLVMAGIFIIVLAFNGPKDTTSEVDAIYTNAALTLDAQVLTLQAGMLSATPNPALNSPTPSLTLLPSPTLQVQTPVVFSTSTVAVGGATGCDNSVYISDVTIPDGTTVAPGQAFTKTWKVSNTGTCAWTAAYQITFLSGDIMGGKATAIGIAVNPGQSADISVALTAPATAGSITGTWRLSNGTSQPFGTFLTVVIKTGAGTVSATPTNTTSGSAATSTTAPVAATATPTNTSTPTVTFTPTP